MHVTMPSSKERAVQSVPRTPPSLSSSSSCDKIPSKAIQWSHSDDAGNNLTPVPDHPIEHRSGPEGMEEREGG
jgi:hypothetical protein